MSQHSNKIGSRLSTIRYEMTRDFMAHYTANKIPEFTEENEEMMLKIFQIPNMETCIVTGETIRKSGGDHLFEVRGYLRKTGKCGIEQKWNRLPVSTGQNVKYKKYKCHDKTGKEYKKNIGWEELTEDEFNQQTDDMKERYLQIRKWMKYCQSQGVSLGWELPEEAVNEMEKSISIAMENLQKGLTRMKEISD